LGWFGCGCESEANTLTILEKFAYTIRPTNAVMQLQLAGEMHEQARSHPRAPGRAQDHADARPEATVARPVRQRAAALQPPLPGEPAGLPHPGTGLWRAEAGDVRRLERLGEELDGGDKKKRRIRADRERPITGTRLLREWQGVEHVVTVTADGFEWQGRPYKSLSAIARAITGTRWNGWVFFGLKNHRGRT
jgi:hypothetical protein